MGIRKILETTVTGGYPNDGSTGPASDDDLPVGTTVFGDKMVPVKVPNRLTGYTVNYVPADDVGEKWDYSEFEYSKGMDSEKAYSQTLKSLDGILGDRLWKRTKDVKMRFSQDKWEKWADNDIDQTSKISDDDEETMEITEKIGKWLGDGDDKVIINEELLSAPDRKILMKAILKAKNTQMKFKSLDVDSNLTNYDDEVVISYKPNDEFTMALVDASDSLGMDFQVTKDGSKTAFRIIK